MSALRLFARASLAVALLSGAASAQQILVSVTPAGMTSRLRPGARFAFSGSRPGGERFEWTAEVLEIEAPARIELAYAGGEYEGRTAWELETVGNGTTVAYIYRGVRPLSQRARDHFARWGTRLHSVAMREDALAGLARLHGGPAEAPARTSCEPRASWARVVTTGGRELGRRDGKG